MTAEQVVVVRTGTANLASVAAPIFHYGEYTVAPLKAELAKMGLEVRL